MNHQYIHFIHGASAAATLKSAIGNDEVIAMEDWLSFGPLLPFDNRRNWDANRNIFWKGYFGLMEAGDIRDFSKLVTCRNKIDRATNLILWIGPSLNEQIFFAWIVSALQYLSISPKNTFYVPVYKSFPDVQNLGRLSQKHFLDARKEIKHLTNTALILEIWKYISSTTPEWTTCAHLASLHYPLLAERLKLIKSHFPTCRNGLDVWSCRLLKAVESSGPRSINVISEMTSLYYQEPDFPSDLLISARIIKLSDKKLAHPLLSIEGELPLRKLTVKLTETGIRVLQNNLNNVTLNGVDEWVGGVHIKSPPGPIWCYDPIQDELILNLPSCTVKN